MSEKYLITNTKTKMMGNYKTLCFKTKKQALKSEIDIKSYFSQIENSKIIYGEDERGNKGYYVKYILN